MRVGIGYTDNGAAEVAGRMAATAAAAQGNIDRPTLVLAFCSGRLDAEGFLSGLRTIVGPDVPILGGSAIGVVTNDSLSYEGFPAGVALLQFDGEPPRIATVSGLDHDEQAAGRRLGEQFRGAASGQPLLLFYDSVKRPPSPGAPPVINASPPLIAGIEESLQPGYPIVGAGVIGDYDFNPTWQFCGTTIGRQSAVGALLGNGLHAATQIMHGFAPMDGVHHRITRMAGSIIHEIDGKPAAIMIDTLYGDQHWRQQRPVKRLAIGVHHGERHGPFHEEAFVNRLIAGVLPGSESILLFEPDLHEGMEILFMLREGSTMVESARRNSLALLERVGKEGRQPAFSLYIDCAGRTAVHSETLTEEAAEVQAVMNHQGVPLLGFYSGVEIAPLLGRSRGLDWTGVLLILSGP